MTTRADLQGVGRRSGSPLRFVRGWSFVEVWWVREGLQRLCLPYYCHFFCFARQYYTNILHISILQSSMFSMERSSFPYISLIQNMKWIQLPISCFYQRAFWYFPSLELHDFTSFKQKIVPRPPLPCHPFAWVWESFNCTRRPFPTENKLECKL